jgi:hypothetical protein
LYGGTGKITEVIIPLGVFDELPFDGRIIAAGQRTVLLLGHDPLRLVLLLDFLQKGILHKFLLDALHKFKT